MSLANVEKPRDPLATLRISRAAPPRPSRPRRRWLRRLLVLMLLIVLAGGGLIAATTSQRWELLAMLEPRLEVRVASVSVQTGRAADATVVATGYLESRRQAMIGARAPGRIETLNVEEGTRVKKGDVLAALEHADLDAALAANKAELTRSRAQVAEQEVEIARTRREYERAIKLQPTRAMSEAEIDDAKFQYEAAVARMKSLKAAVSLAEARVREAEQIKENMFVRAPFDGTVISKDAEVGESIMPGGMGESSGRGSVVTIADLERLEVDCDVKEDYIGRVIVGRPAEVAVDAVTDYRYQGRVRKIIPMGDRARATIKVKVEILDADERLFPEMSGTVFFLPDESDVAKDAPEQRIFCPTDAIVTNAEESHVWILDGDDKLQRREVRIGDANDGRTEILAGLEGGERVVVDPPADVRIGQLVTVSE
jgi:RND family efflux transporter MFP subunit